MSGSGTGTGTGRGADPAAVTLVAAARRDAFALVTAAADGLAAEPFRLVVDWFDRETRPDARTVVFAEQLVLWAALLAALRCRDHGHPPGGCRLRPEPGVDATADQQQRHRDAVGAVTARLARDVDGEHHLLDRHLCGPVGRAEAALFLGQLAQVAVELVRATATQRGRSTRDVLAELGVAAALAHLGSG